MKKVILSIIILISSHSFLFGKGVKSQIIRQLVIKGKENLNKHGVYKIIFKDGSTYAGKAKKQTIEQRLKNRSKKWLLNIKSIEAKAVPIELIDKVERSIIGGATRAKKVLKNGKIGNYLNDKFNRIKHPNTRSKYFWEKKH